MDGCGTTARAIAPRRFNHVLNGSMMALALTLLFNHAHRRFNHVPHRLTTAGGRHHRNLTWYGSLGRGGTKCSGDKRCEQHAGPLHASLAASA